MRIIKLSPKDIDFPDRSIVYDYFQIKLPSRSPVGQFLLTRSRIAEEGISVGEPIIFSYETEITHIAKAASGRLLNAGGDRETYPFYFIVDMSTVFLAKGSLADLENALSAIGINKNIIRTQGWPRILDSLEADKIWNKYKKYARTCHSRGRDVLWRLFRKAFRAPQFGVSGQSSNVQS